MKKKDIILLATKIANAEREIQLGKNIESNERKIEIYLQNLSPTDLIKVVLEIEKILDK
jgi:hypothetical protein